MYYRNTPLVNTYVIQNGRKPKKIGRPKLPKGRLNSSTLADFANDLALITSAAKASGEAVPDWMRNALTKAAKRVIS